MKIVSIIIAALWLAAVIGWCLNVYKIVSDIHPLASWTAIQIIRVVGVFLAPLGSVLGYM